MDVSRATAAEKQQRPFLPATVAASSSLSPLPGADKGDAGIYFFEKKKSISPSKPSTQFCCFSNFTRPSRRTWRNTPRFSSRRIDSASQRLQRSARYYITLSCLSHCSVYLDPADWLLFLVLCRNWSIRDAQWWKSIASTARPPWRCIRSRDLFALSSEEVRSLEIMAASWNSRLSASLFLYSEQVRDTDMSHF